MEKKLFFKAVKLAGFVTFLPFIMVAGPLVGYLAGVYLRDKFRLGDRAVAIAVFIGLAASVMEAVRVIRLIIRLGGEP